MVREGEFIEYGITLSTQEKRKFSTDVQMIVELCVKIRELEERIKKLEEK